MGQLTAATLVAYLPELGRWGGRALTSLVGLAPWSRDSGEKRGNRSIRGGRGTVRRTLYICAWVVLRIDGDLRDFYQRLRERGKPGKVAVIAVARKLLMQLNAVAASRHSLGETAREQLPILSGRFGLTINTDTSL